MSVCSALLAICERNPPLDSPHKWPVMQNAVLLWLWRNHVKLTCVLSVTVLYDGTRTQPESQASSLGETQTEEEPTTTKPTTAPTTTTTKPTTSTSDIITASRGPTTMPTTEMTTAVSFNSLRASDAYMRP